MALPPSRTAGAVLIVLIGLLNFHIPHFLLESRADSGSGPGIELVFLANVSAAVTAAVGIWRKHQWGWSLGILVAAASLVLYVLQESVGLPGLPQNWLEPSRIVVLALEAVFAALALAQFTPPRRAS